MGSFVLYILEWSLSLLLFLLIWKLAFAGTTLHRFNRFYLLGVTLVSALIPLAGIETAEPQPLAIESTQFANVLQQVEIYAPQSAHEVTQIHKTAQDRTWAWVLVALYCVYVSVLVIGWMRSVFRMFLYLNGKNYHRLGQGIRLYQIDGDAGPFSWMNCIVISRKENGFARHAGLLHEWCHICMRHYADLVFLLLCTIVNPTCWLVLREIKPIHEFEADAEVIRRLGNKSVDYQKLLIMRTVGAEAYALASSFDSNIKQRIIMMKKEKTLRRRMLYLLVTVPVTALLFMACGTHGKVLSQSAASTTSALTEEVYENDVDEMAEYPGGVVSLLEYMRRTIIYPAEAREKGVQGRVIVRFIVEKDGSITDVHVEDNPRSNILTCPQLLDKQLGDEAVRTVSQMSKFKPAIKNGQPVRISYAVPVNFRLDNGESVDTKDMIIVSWKKNKEGEKQVLCMLTGKNHATADAKFIKSRKTKSYISKIKKTDEGIFFLENDTTTNRQFENINLSINEALRGQDKTVIMYQMN